MRANMLKGVVRAMVMASLTTCASTLGEGNTTNSAAEYIMAAYVVVFEQFPISSALLLNFIMVLIVIICVLQGNRQQTVVIHGRDESYTASSCGSSSKSNASDSDNDAPRSSTTTSRGQPVEPEILCTQCHRRILTVPVENSVWHTGVKGKCYRLLGCKALSGSVEIFECGEQRATNVGLRSCSFCNPRKRYRPEEFAPFLSHCRKLCQTKVFRRLSTQH